MHAQAQFISVVIIVLACSIGVAMASINQRRLTVQSKHTAVTVSCQFCNNVTDSSTELGARFGVTNGRFTTNRVVCLYSDIVHFTSLFHTTLV